MEDIKIPIINTKTVMVNKKPIVIQPLSFGDYVDIREELSKNEDSYISIVKKILYKCSDLDSSQIENYPMADAIDLILQICAISSKTGSFRDLEVKCSSCDAVNEVSIDLREDYVDNEIYEETITHTIFNIKITNNVSIKNSNRSAPYCYVTSIFDGDNNYYLSDIHNEDDYKKYCEFVDNFITMSSSYHVNELEIYTKVIKKDYNCLNTNCEHRENEIYLGTLTSFFI